MKRKCNPILRALDGKRAIYVDAENQDEILAYLRRDERHLKKFKFITDIILGGHINREVYDKEKTDSKTKDVRAMKFFKGADNDRIYCKEVRSKDKVYVVIMCILHEKKKTTKLKSKEINIIDKIGGYEYEI